MEVTPPTTVEPRVEAVGLAPDVEAYLDRLAAEHNKFLGAIAAASSMLETSDLAAYASVHARLNQDFLDAQRALIRRQADALAEVRRLDVRLNHPSHATSCCEEIGPVDDAELARLIDEAFEPVGPDGAEMRDQLRRLLDGWWLMRKATADAGAAEAAGTDDQSSTAVADARDAADSFADVDAASVESYDSFWSSAPTPNPSVARRWSVRSVELAVPAVLISALFALALGTIG
jgi:hypothetical protein